MRQTSAQEKPGSIVLEYGISRVKKERKAETRHAGITHGFYSELADHEWSGIWTMQGGRSCRANASQKLAA